MLVYIQKIRNTLNKNPGLAAYLIIGLIFISIVYLLQRYNFEIHRLIANPNRREELITNILTTLQDFITLTLGVIVEALPFVVLGVLFSVVIQKFIPSQKLIKHLPKNSLLRRVVVSFLGVFMPVCECGNVPVARSLMIKGFTIQEAIIFLLAAPSVNIITFIVTTEAFNFERSVAVIRIVATLIIANLVAYFVTKFINAQNILTKDFKALCKASEHEPHTIASAVSVFRSEMWLIMRMLVFGAMIAAASQTFIPREVLTSIGSDPALAVVAMLILAFVISICSSVDAFFALAYVNTFSLGSIISFLVAGPMVDIKMLALMKTTFTTRVLVVTSLLVLGFSFVLGLGLSYAW